MQGGLSQVAGRRQMPNSTLTNEACCGICGLHSRPAWLSSSAFHYAYTMCAPCSRHSRYNFTLYCGTAGCISPCSTSKEAAAGFDLVRSRYAAYLTHLEHRINNHDLLYILEHPVPEITLPPRKDHHDWQLIHEMEAGLLLRPVQLPY